jgi:hypothetical protein
MVRALGAHGHQRRFKRASRALPLLPYSTYPRAARRAATYQLPKDQARPTVGGASLHATTLAPSKGRPISFAMRWTVPVPTLHSLATARMPLPVRNWLWIRFSIAGFLRSPELLTRFYSPPKPGADPLADHAALELGKRTSNLKHQPPGRRRRVNRLLVEVKSRSRGAERLAPCATAQPLDCQLWSGAEVAAAVRLVG